MSLREFISSLNPFNRLRKELKAAMDDIVKQLTDLSADVKARSTAVTQALKDTKAALADADAKLAKIEGSGLSISDSAALAAARDSFQAADDTLAAAVAAVTPPANGGEPGTAGTGAPSGDAGSGTQGGQ